MCAGAACFLGLGGLESVFGFARGYSWNYIYVFFFSLKIYCIYLKGGVSERGMERENRERGRERKCESLLPPAGSPTRFLQQANLGLDDADSFKLESGDPLG